MPLVAANTAARDAEGTSTAEEGGDGEGGDGEGGDGDSDQGEAEVRADAGGTGTPALL